MARFKCSKCGLEKQTPDKFLGDLVNCPKCQGLVEIGIDDDADLGMDLVFDDASTWDELDPESAARAAVNLDALDNEEEAQVPLFQGGVVRNLAAGVGGGVLLFFFCLAYASLFLMAGNESTPFPHILGFTLVGAALVSVFTAAGSRIPYAIAGPDASICVFVFLMLASVHKQASLAPDAAPFPTMAAAVAVSSLLCGGLIHWAGRLGLGEWLRYVPQVVIGGVAAGVGAFMLRGGWDIMTYTIPCLGSVVELGGGMEYVLAVGPALGFGLLLASVSRGFKNSLVLLTPILAVIALANGAILFSDAALSHAVSGCWTYGSFAATDVFRAIFTLEFFASIQWRVLLDHAPYMLALAGVCVIAVSMRVMEFELDEGRPLDMDRELRVVGAANGVSGLCGGLPGVLCHGRSLGNKAAGGVGPASGVTAGIVCGLGLFAAGSVIPFIPLFVTVGLLFFSGFSLLHRWLVQVRRRYMQSLDYALMLGIFGLTLAIGLLPAFAVALAVGLLMVISRYSRMGVVRNALSGARYHSSVDRAASQIRFLDEEGWRISILRLQGYLFLGSVYAISKAIRQAMQSPEHPDLSFIVLDFTRVSGVSSMASGGLAQLVNLTRPHGVNIVFTNVPFETQRLLEKNGNALNAPDNTSRSFVDLDYALEWCENELLEEAGWLTDEADQSLEQLLAPLFPDPAYAVRLKRVMKKLHVPRGQVVFRQGAPSKTMFFIEKGMVNIQLELHKGKILRLRKAGPGSIVGEMGLYGVGERTATVVAAEDCIVYQLSRRTVEALREKDSALSAAVHNLVVQQLVTRVAEANAKVRELML